MVFDKKHPIKIIYIKNESFVFAQPPLPQKFHTPQTWSSKKGQAQKVKGG